MLAFADKHKLKPVIERTFPLAQAKEALVHLRDHHSFGKVVVTI